MSVIDTAEFLRGVRESLSLRENEHADYLNLCLKFTVIELSKKFSTLFYNEATLDSDANGVITLPSDTFRIISVRNGLSEAQPQDLRTFNIYANRNFEASNALYAAAKQFPDRVEVRLLPRQAYTGVYVLYQNLASGLGNIPFEYQEVVFLGTRTRFLSTKRMLEKEQNAIARADYKAQVDALTLEQNKMYAQEKIKNYWERDWERYFVSYPIDGTMDIWT